MVWSNTVLWSEAFCPWMQGWEEQRSRRGGDACAMFFLVTDLLCDQTLLLSPSGVSGVSVLCDVCSCYFKIGIFTADERRMQQMGETWQSLPQWWYQARLQ